MSADDDAPDLPPPVPAAAAAALVRRVTFGVLAACAMLAALGMAPAHVAGAGLSQEIRRSAIAALPLSALLVLLAGLLASWTITRWRAAASADARLAGRLARAARIPQAAIVAPLGLAAAGVAWVLRPALGAVAIQPHGGFVLGGVAVALAFFLLILERNLAAANTAVLPEAPGLRALAFLATGVCFAAGVLELVAAIGVAGTGYVGDALALLVALVGVELSLRALGRLFLPAPAPRLARAAVTSLIARGVSAGAQARGGVAAPLRQHLGIDFSRSWALAYVRAAVLPMVGFFLALAWGLSGVVLVPLDGRAVYERFGAPVAVLHPGLHVGLPWPLGTALAVEYGPVHAIGLSESGVESAAAVGAEDLAPASADRLWEQPHPAEVELLIASEAGGRQSFQSVAADLRILYRVGLSDADALRAAYRVADPAALVRASAGRVVAAYFAARTLDQVLGANREAMADGLRAGLQAALDRADSGLEAVAVVIEAIHPPAGAADAYHNVRAAEIAARASVAVEHGAAATIYAQSRQYAFSQTSNAQAGAAENVGAARTALLRFTADQDAAKAGGQSFLLERYFGALQAALGKSPKTIIDHRLNWPEAPVLDLRPFAAAAAGGTGKEE
jgi:regulator of protease activity HflC (stomatin/prohibitin superfamily)